VAKQFPFAVLLNGKGKKDYLCVLSVSSEARGEQNVLLQI
jgi:hypothetical protein